MKGGRHGLFEGTILIWSGYFREKHKIVERVNRFVGTDLVPGTPRIRKVLVVKLE
jgi:hypothetical protein